MSGCELWVYLPLTLCYFVLFDCHLFKACCFLKSKQMGSQSVGQGKLKDLGGVEWGEFVVGKYYMRK